MRQAMMTGWAGLQTIGKMLLAMGAFIAFLGAMLWLSGRFPGVFRLLPGDILIRKGNFVFFFPIVTCILISAALTLLFYLVLLFRR